jgi:hypothetical protein
VERPAPAGSGGTLRLPMKTTLIGYDWLATAFVANLIVACGKDFK